MHQLPSIKARWQPPLTCEIQGIHNSSVPELVGGGGGGSLGEREMEEERESGRENENTERLYRMML
jgi:hypothetical protein